MLDLWRPEAGVRRVLAGYGRGETALPVFKMPHLEGWAVADGHAFIPAVGRHELLVIDLATWTEAGRIPVEGQPVFVVARPDGRQLWVNFALPDNGVVQVIDVPSLQGGRDRLEPGPAVLHLEFTPRGERGLALGARRRPDQGLRHRDFCPSRHPARRQAVRHLLHRARPPDRFCRWTPSDQRLLDEFQRGLPARPSPLRGDRGTAGGERGRGDRPAATGCADGVRLAASAPCSGPHRAGPARWRPWRCPTGRCRTSPPSSSGFAGGQPQLRARAPAEPVVRRDCAPDAERVRQVLAEIDVATGTAVLDLPLVGPSGSIWGFKLRWH